MAVMNEVMFEHTCFSFYNYMANCDRLEAEVKTLEKDIERLIEEIETIRRKITSPIAKKQREDQLKQWTDEWSKEQWGGNPECPIYHHSKFLKKLKQELLLEKDRLSSDLQEGRRNKFSPKMVSNNRLWKKDNGRWANLTAPSKSDDDYEWEEGQFIGNKPEPPSTFSGMLNKFRTRTNSLFRTGIGGKRKRIKTRRKSKK